MLNAQLQAELETEIRSLFPESGMEQYTALVMGAVDAALNKAVSQPVVNDFAVAHLLTSALNLYLQQEEKAIAIPQPTNKIQWTGPKTGLVELIYALHADSCFNNGGATLVDIVAAFEATFRVELPQYHKTYSDIRARKTERTKFLNNLGQRLLNQMDEADAR